MTLSDDGLCAIGLLLYSKYYQARNEIENGKDLENEFPEDTQMIEEILIDLTEQIEQKEEARKKSRIIRQKKRLRRPKRLGVKKVGVFEEMLLNERISVTCEKFQNIFQMKASIFKDLLSLLNSCVGVPTFVGFTIPPETRLLVTLYYFITGQPFKQISRRFQLACSTVGGIVYATCQTLVKVLNYYVKIPQTAADWKKIAKGFQESCNFPHCLGAVDCRHIRLTKPFGPDAFEYLNQTFFSMVLLGIVNANYEFIFLEAGIKGKLTDEGVLAKSDFGNAFYENSLNLPKPSPLSGGTTSFPYVFTGKEAFHLEENFLTPYYRDHLSEEQRVFNNHLNRVTRIAESTFEMLGSKFGVLRSKIFLQPEKARVVMLAVCQLHNYFRQKCPDEYMPTGTDGEGCLKVGTINEGLSYQKPLTKLEPIPALISYNTAEQIRNQFSLYFSEED